MLSGAESPGRSPISTATQAAPSAAAMASPIATRPWRTMTSGAMRQPSARNAAIDLASTGLRVQLHGARRQSVGDHEDDVIVAAVRGQRRFGTGARRRPRSGRIK